MHRMHKEQKFLTDSSLNMTFLQVIFVRHEKLIRSRILAFLAELRQSFGRDLAELAEFWHSSSGVLFLYLPLHSDLSCSNVAALKIRCL